MVRVSVVIPCYNAAAHLAATLHSVMSQTHPVHEVLVVDDGSRDDSVHIAASFGGPVRVIRQANRGPSAARNVGAAQSNSDVVALLDADDMWVPCKIERQLEYLQRNPSLGAVVSSHTSFGVGAAGVMIGPIVDAQLRALAPIDFVAKCRIMPSALLMAARLAKSTPFPENTSYGEDLIHAALLRTQSVIGAIEDPLVQRRLHPAQLSRAAGCFRKSLAARLDWACASHAVLGLPSPQHAADAIWEGAAEEVMNRYWCRQTREFRELRRELLLEWPKDRPVPKSLVRLALPRALLKAKDFMTGSIESMFRRTRTRFH